MRNVIVPILIFLFAALIPVYAQANYAAGGEIFYTHISDSTYQFFVVLYRDCSGNSEPSSVPICFYNSCTNSTFSLTANKYTGTVPYSKLGPGCPSIKTTCDSPGSTIPGYEAYWYTRIATLPMSCKSWKFYTHFGGRSSSNNINNPASQPLYLEATFDNTISHQNSSPAYSIPPSQYNFLNTTYVFNNGATDADGDSLMTFLIHPLTGVDTCGDTAKNVTYASASPPYSIPNNPIQTYNSFSFHSFSGQAVFTPTQAGKSTLTVRTNEYRNGKLIGSVMREQHIITVPGSGNIVTLQYTLGCGANPTGPNNTLYTCPGQALSFCFSVYSTDSTLKLYTSDNHKASIPAATVNHYGQGSDSAHGTFSWTPTKNDGGVHYLGLMVVDSTCKQGSLLQRYWHSITIYVLPATTTNNDTFICPGGQVQLNAKGNGGFIWAILPGGSPNSLSCTACASPIATPAVTTSYVVTGNTSCADSSDTVTVTVLPPSSVTYPNINITVSPDSNIHFGDPVTFTATASGCNNPKYQWLLNGSMIPNATGATFTPSFALYNNQKITCNLICNDSCPSPKNVISNAITMHVKVGVENINKQYKIHIYPNPNKGTFTIEVPGAGDSTTEITLLNTMGATVYSEKINCQGSTSCKQVINSTSLPAGIYLIKVKYAGTTLTERFMIYK